MTRATGARLVIGFSLCIAAAEAVVAFVDPLAGAIAHAALLGALVNVHALAPGPAREDPVLRAVLALTLVPLLRLISFALAIDDDVWTHALAGVPLALALVLVLRQSGASGIVAARGEGRPLAAAGIAAAGVPLGLLGYLILDVEARADDPPLVLATAVGVSFVFGGVLEEVLFRGVLQRDLGAALGRSGVAVACLLYAAVYFGSRSDDYAALHALLGVAFAAARAATGSVAGAALAHGIMASGMLVLWPLVL